MSNPKSNVAPSPIGKHGNDYTNAANDSLHAWRCSYCKKDYLVIMKSGSVSNAQIHLRGSHSVDCDSVKSSSKRSIKEEEGEVLESIPF